MEAKDLRIGNLVNITDWSYSSFTGVHILTLDNISCIDKGLILAEPIPLTEEWQNKLGLKYFQGYMILRMLGSNFVFGISKTGTLYVKNGDWTTYFKYVHEFQNYIHALTGKELEIKE